MGLFPLGRLDHLHFDGNAHVVPSLLRRVEIQPLETDAPPRRSFTSTTSSSASSHTSSSVGSVNQTLSVFPLRS